MRMNSADNESLAGPGVFPLPRRTPVARNIARGLRMPFDDYYRVPRHVSRHSTYTLIAARPRSLARGCYLPIHTEERTPVLLYTFLCDLAVSATAEQQRRLSYRRANKSKRNVCGRFVVRRCAQCCGMRSLFFSLFSSFFLSFFLWTKFHPAFVTFAAIFRGGGRFQLRSIVRQAR